MSFLNKNNQAPLSPRAVQMNRLATARGNLLLVVLFTLINVVLGVAGAGTYFLFSAFIPYFLVMFGMIMCGKVPIEWPDSELLPMPQLDTSFLVIMVSIAAVILLVYFLLWLLSKRYTMGCLIAALVLFALDTLAFLFLGGISADSIIDLLFHAWVLYYLIVGIVAVCKLKKLPPEDTVVLTAEGTDEAGDASADPAVSATDKTPEEDGSQS